MPRRLLPSEVGNEESRNMDKKTVTILNKYFFPVAFGGTNDGDQNTAEEIAFLHSLDIHPETVLHVTHAKAVARLRSAIVNTDLRAVADAFIVGLHPDRCVYRAGLRAYGIGMSFPAHSFQPHNRDNPSPSCRTCGMEATDEVSLAYLEMLRHRDGSCGFNHQPYYAAYALERFNESEPPKPTGDDFNRFNELLTIIRSADPGTTANVLANQFRSLAKGSKYTRRYILETLGYCSILETQDHKGFLDGWVPWIENGRPPTHNNELDTPVAWWKASDGINIKALRHFFPQGQIKL